MEGSDRRWILSKSQGGHHTLKRNEGYLPMVADIYGTDAEAQLIAAAPEMFAALTAIVRDQNKCACCTNSDGDAHYATAQPNIIRAENIIEELTGEVTNG